MIVPLLPTMIDLIGIFRENKDAAYSISKLKKPLSTMLDELSTIRGVGTTTEHIIREILRTGRSSLYEKFLQE